MSLGGQTGLSVGLRDIVQHQVKRAEWATRPGFADFTEQPMFDRVPLGRAGRVMAHSHRQSQPISQLLLKLLFEHVTAGAIRPTPIGFNEQVSGAGKALRQFRLAPVQQIIDGEGRGISRLADIHCALIMLLVIDAIRDRPPHALAGKIVHIHLFWLLTPNSPVILKVAHQLLFLGIYAEGRLTRLLMRCALLPDIAELGVPIGMRLAFAFLDIQPQVIPRRFQQPTNDRAAHTMS